MKSSRNEIKLSTQVSPIGRDAKVDEPLHLRRISVPRRRAELVVPLGEPWSDVQVEIGNPPLAHHRLAVRSYGVWLPAAGSLAPREPALKTRAPTRDAWRRSAHV